MTGDENIIATRVRLAGRVQGVWFRGWTMEEAVARGLRGWVRNRIDGTVEALFIGDVGAVGAMIEACREGPAMARVTAIREFTDADDGEAGFRQLPTV